MYDKRTVNVPVRWILGDPEELERVYLHSEWMELRDHFDWPDVRSMLEGDGVKFGESCYSGEVLLGLLDQTVNDCDPDCVWDLSDVVAVTYRYHEWLEVLVLKSFATGRDVIAYLVLGNEDYTGQSLADLEPDVARAVTQNAFIAELSM